MKDQSLLFFDNAPAGLIDKVVQDLNPSGVFLLADTNTARLVLPRLQDSVVIRNVEIITIPAGEQNKNLDTLVKVWQTLVDRSANRKSLLINVGGGVVTDLGGFAAATFKRGIAYINIPTTLLGAVDASHGGKTAIDFAGFKNEIGSFYLPHAIIVSASLLETLDMQQILSGYAEMLKHALLDGTEMTDQLLAYDIANYTPDTLLPMMQQSMQVKADVIRQDPYERGLRKVLNFGHTVGHAFESMAIDRGKPIPHGYAVAFGMVAELILSHTQVGFSSALLHSIAKFVKTLYGSFAISCNDYPQLMQQMRHDKKNLGNGINFTLLRAPGDPKIDCIVPDVEIETALDIYCDIIN